jgi:16S rRNA (uracil1498-N3)-methyltransferase
VARLFVASDRWESAEIVLHGDEHRYVCRVLRLHQGDRLTLFDGRGHECDVRLASVGGREARAVVEARRAGVAPAHPVLTLLMGLCKGERMDFVVQKATELGAARVIPVETARSVPRLEPARAHGRRARWGTIAREAARQCGRADGLVIDEVQPLAAALEAVRPAPLKVLFWEEGSAPLRELVGGEPPSAVAVAVGPEGGFAAAEVDAARAAGFVVATLGPRILRAETAAVVALALLGYAVGDLGGG